MKIFGEKNVKPKGIEILEYSEELFTVFVLDVKTWGRSAFQVSARSADAAELLVYEYLDSENQAVAGVVKGAVYLVG